MQHLVESLVEHVLGTSKQKCEKAKTTDGLACGPLLKNACTLLSQRGFGVLTAQRLVAVSAVIHLVIIYNSHLLLKWLD